MKLCGSGKLPNFSGPWLGEDEYFSGSTGDKYKRDHDHCKLQIHHDH